jgi:hypothetical protein
MKQFNKMVLTGIITTMLYGGTHAQYVWTKSNILTLGYLNSVIWTGNQFIIGGYHIDTTTNFLTYLPTILTSQNGNTWATIEVDSSIKMAIYSVAYGNGNIVAVGTGGLITSQDGTNWIWVKKTTDTSNIGVLNSITWINDKFIAVGSNGGLNVDTALAISSSDGISWTRLPMTKNGGLYSVTWTGSQIVAIGSTGLSRGGDSNYSAISSDGQSWNYTYIPRPLYYTMPATGGGAQSITWTGNKLVAVGKVWKTWGIDPPYIFYSTFLYLSSPDGNVWNQNLPTWDTTDKNLNSVLWTGEQFISVGNEGENGIIKISPNYSTWTKIDNLPACGQLYSIAKSDSLLVVVGGNATILTSPISTTKAISIGPRVTLKALEIYRNFVSCSLSQEFHVSINLYNLHGQLVKTLCNRTQTNGMHKVMIPSGIAQGNYILTFSNVLTKINRTVFIGK